MEYKYHRILLKLSGEAIAEKVEDPVSKKKVITGPYDVSFIKEISSKIKTLIDAGVQVAVVTGGGNVFRGAQAKEFTRARADDIGMLVTVMNALAVENILNVCGVPAVSLTAVEMTKVAPLFTKARAEEYLNSGHAVIFGGGTGNPYFSTDTAAILRGCEINADAVFLAKNVDAVYAADPKEFPDAPRFDRISLNEFIERQLKAIDLTAAVMANNAGKQIELFSLSDPENILRAARGESAGTTIYTE